MVNYTGSTSFVLAGVESTFNTAVSPTKDLGITASISTDETNNIIDIRGIGDRESCDLIAGNYDVTLSVEGTLNSGAVLEMFFGQSTDAETTGDYKHTFVDRGTLDIANDVLSYTIQPNLDSTSDVTFAYAGCKINTLDVSVEVNQVITFSCEIIGASVDTGTTAGTQVKTSTVPLAFSQATLSTGDEASESALSQVQSFNISFNNNIDPNDIRGLGSREAQGLIAKNLETTGEFTMKFQNKTEAERFLGGATASTSTPTDTGLIFTANNGVTLGSGRVELYIKLLGVQYESLGRTISEEGVVEETFSFRATNIDDVYFVDAVSTYF